MFGFKRLSSIHSLRGPRIYVIPTYMGASRARVAVFLTTVLRDSNHGVRECMFERCGVDVGAIYGDRFGLNSRRKAVQRLICDGL